MDDVYGSDQNDPVRTDPVRTGASRTDVVAATPALPLRDASLPLLAARVRVPTYDRSALTPAVVHLGVGSFHRAHQAVYLDDLAEQGETGWGEIGVGLRSAALRDALLPQDWLFTVVERDGSGDRARVVGSMVGYLFAPDDPGAVLDVLADPRTRLVTLTITADGYGVDADGAFPGDEPDVLGDLACPHAPRTVFGFLVEALDRRRRAGLPAFTVLSCDNVPDSGRTARAAVVGFARLRDADLAGWIDASVCFPNSMVDRITPETDDATRALVDGLGVADRAPVVAEPFRQWVVEDAFSGGRPPLERVGVQLVADVAPYKLMKTRLLNAGHSALGYLGTLAGGYRTSSEALGNPVLADYLRVLLREEVAPLLPDVPGVDLAAYQETLLERFANPAISDQLARLCRAGSSKVPANLLPSLVRAREQGRPSMLLTIAVAAWFCYLRGYDVDGAPMEVRDARRDVLQPLALAGGRDPRPLLAEREVFGGLADDPGFAELLGWVLQDLEVYGPVATICDHLSQNCPAAPRARRSVGAVRPSEDELAGLRP